MGGDGDDAADPCRVMLNRPCDAGEISNISLAVIACSAHQYRPSWQLAQNAYRSPLSRRVYETRVLDSCRRLSSWIVSKSTLI